jgi:hypothetical protein
MRSFLFICLLFISKTGFNQTINITIDPTKEVKPISPYLYGRNNNLPKESYATALTAARWTQLRESGIQFLREGGGNNSTKYNWRKGLSSHPDWYNNVYGQNWDNSVRHLNDSLPPSVTGMWTLPLIGKAAANTSNNFNDWNYNRSQWWAGVHQNLAGGGTVNTAGGNKALVNGNPNLYLENWSPDSVVGILDHWRNTLRIPDSRITYWNMDNEPEIWHGTHDDIANSSLPAETFMQTYFATAKKARARFPNIKLVGPVPANEWQWYNWANRITGADGKYYPWLEFFIKRCAEEQAASGVRLLDVLDIHFYPSESTTEQIMQLHRVFFDRDYNYPGANGVKSMTGGWNTSLTKEYIFGRINDWLTQYFGANHGIKLGLTEIDINSEDPSVNAIWYASTMGEFMKNGVEIFTPWSWKKGMWETVHLFARYNQTLSVQGVSSDEWSVSAYPSVNAAKNTLTIVLVNRSSTAEKTVRLDVHNFMVQTASVNALRLSALPNTETFVSHTQNALQSIPVNFSNNESSLILPPLSVTSMTVSGRTTTPVNDIPVQELIVSPNPTTHFFELKNCPDFDKLKIIDVQGKVVQILGFNASNVYDISTLPKGVYHIYVASKTGVWIGKLVKI